MLSVARRIVVLRFSLIIEFWSKRGLFQVWTL